MSERRRRTHFDPLRRGLQGGHVDVAPAQEAEQALHENHQQYRALFGQMLEGVAYCQMLFDEAGQPVDWIYLEVNPAFEALTGLRDAAGKRVTQLIPGVRETNPELFEFYGRVAKTGVPEQFETYLAALERWFSVKVYRPQAGHVAAVFENISEARRTEQALRDSAALLNEMQELARIGGWAYDVASETVFWTDEVYRIHEVSPHEYNPNSAEQDIEFYAPEDQGRIDKAFRLAVEEGRPYDLELRLVTAKGREIRVRTAAQPQLQDGRVVRIYGHIQDITERKAAEEEIQGAHDLLRQFFDANIIGTLVVRDSGATLEANDYFLNLIGRTREELERGEIDWRAITPPEWLPVSDHAIGEMRARGAYDPYEKEYLRPDGTRVPVLVAATSLSGPGELIAAFVLDNTERKRAEAEVLTLNAELEDRVVARTAALEAANRELEAFSYSVSHDLRAPLRSIDAFSEILLREHAEGLNTEARRVLGVVVRNARQMGQLIDDLLALSRVGRIDLERRPVDMGRLARAVGEDLQAAESDRAIEFDIGPLCTVRGDATLLRQAWTNLLGNAAKFTRPMERPRIEVRCRRRGGECRYTVRDNGVGFDPAYADKLFQPFQRLHQTAEFEGTGIGLAIVARIVHRHGGQVWAESAPGEGATFGFSLPSKELT